MFNKNEDLLILKNTNVKNKEKIRKKFFFSSPFLIILLKFFYYLLNILEIKYF
ncbi:hypothetical protein [Rickettsia asembonensis]|uniref:hypothetical protein n=1 Tax=Rickettsia asembonensis TaxID=1068590 RepID=UPI000AF461BC|nr:hypothetical protein [Rickettsia asembonensis]WCR56758.1 MAG: hypothetical protein PG979_000815 [Rickettsia asembonensis]